MNDAQLKLLVRAQVIQDALDYFDAEVKDADPDERHCCDGQECMCGGMSKRDYWKNVAGVDDEEEES